MAASGKTQKKTASSSSKSKSKKPTATIAPTRPPRQPQDHRPSAKTWKRAGQTELELPSGNVCLVRRPGMEQFLSAGLLPDTLTPVITEAIQSGKGMKPKEANEYLKDESDLAQMMESIDRITVKCVVAPKVLLHLREKIDDDGHVVLDKNKKRPVMEEIPPEEREDPDEYLYTDEVDFEDKMFIFQFAVGGSRDLDRFREELADGVGSLHASEGDGD